MKVILVVIALALAYIAYASFRLSDARRIGHEAAARAVPYQRAEGVKKVLVVGDSTAVGVGVTKPEASTAGLLATEFRNVSVTNRAVSGAKLADVIEQLKSVEGTYDLVLMQAGANDVLYFSSYETMQDGVTELFVRAKEKSDNIVVLTAGNIGLAPVLPWPLGYVMTARTKYLRTLMMTEAEKAGVHYIDLYQEHGADTLESDVPRYYAADRLHLSDDGYAYWYSEIRRQAASAFERIK